MFKVKHTTHSGTITEVRQYHRYNDLLNEQQKHENEQCSVYLVVLLIEFVWLDAHLK